MEPILTITPSAVDQVRDLLQDEPTGTCLRVAILGGGCSGFQYHFEFDEEFDESGDYRFAARSEAGAIEVLVDMMSATLLKGAIVDYQHDLQGGRFIVKNPKAKTTCGCGSSFSVPEEEDKDE